MFQSVESQIKSGSTHALIHSQGINGAIRAEFHYTLDAAGNRDQVTETVNGTTNTIDWDYDNAYRLKYEKRYTGSTTTGTPWHTALYDYDDAGNRTTETVNGQTTTYVYNVNDQLDSLTKPGNITVDYTYDARGNLIQIDEGANDTFFTYNGRDQMTSTTLPVVGQITYRYDHDGHRIKQAQGGTTTDYLWDELSAYGDVVWESSGTTTTSYVLGANHLIAQKINSTVSYFLPDAQGSTRTLTDTAGAITATYTYEAFGEVLSQTGTGESNYLYTGQQFDDLTGLYSLRARYYDPAAGRFLSRDTWAYNFRDPAELNRYVYAMGNPVNYSDPSGYFALSELGVKLKKVSLRVAAAAQFLRNWTIIQYTRIMQLFMKIPPAGCMLASVFLFDIPFCGLGGGKSGGGGGGGPDLDAEGNPLPNFNGANADFDADGDPLPNLSGTASDFDLEGNYVGNVGGGGGDGGDGNGTNAPPESWTNWQPPWELQLDSLEPGQVAQIHHIATDKHKTNWTPQFKPIFDRAGMNIHTDSYNLVALNGHEGIRHQDPYHQYVFEQLSAATSGLSGNDYRHALQQELFYLKNELLTPGSRIRWLLFGHD